MPSIGVVVYVRWCKQRSYLANFNCSCGGPLWTLGICVCVCSPASGQLGINHSTVWAVLCRRLCGGGSVARLELENRFSIANCQFDDALSVFVFVGGRQAGWQSGLVLPGYLECALGTWKRCGHNGGHHSADRCCSVYFKVLSPISLSSEAVCWLR